MKVYLDRTHCSIHQPACDSCFGGRLAIHFGAQQGIIDIDVAGCVMEIQEEEDHENITFYVHDRDGEDKVLNVDKENWPDGYNSWMDLYGKQQAKLISD